MVSITYKATTGATMDTVREFLNLPISTFRTILRGISGIYFYQNPIGTFSLIGKILSKLSPCYISNISINRPKVVFFHFIDRQVFNADYTKTINNFSGFLMAKIISKEGLSMDVNQNSLKSY